MSIVSLSMLVPYNSFVIPLQSRAPAVTTHGRQTR